MVSACQRLSIRRQNPLAGLVVVHERRRTVGSEPHPHGGKLGGRSLPRRSSGLPSQVVCLYICGQP